jgi:hypothetical protein
MGGIIFSSFLILQKQQLNNRFAMRPGNQPPFNTGNGMNALKTDACQNRTSEKVLDGSSPG